ncbi:FtsX-like permease family protein [Clostridium estertheticum]|uniref:ABC transporter n=1 Tax=Clostridium estertheticum subsp. estertheticum TaxID=1552 RepID=A0A1J0GGA9_9CLOT|nr:ABC transporter permease [Clostridium estertheticum]APC39942.1 ABC transporter [Clostridium estertheticum subsp. estertheticum]MBU3072561.1 ABC transporter permease [Clostridium estertheticum]MBU3162654.1 ABC transporter permease [Clostridium estertheticum]MBZ9613988.1 ABC transporter permease [Clostridium estertheticum subsp. laramiense]WAG73945.1 ABC transporter permease [Clostridium estertheticum]
MYSKIAVGNVKKSFKDYAIYFLTLTLAVCIFYSFNSIGSQKALIQMKSVSKLMKVMSYVSVFISIILGSLILYANNFLIKKRKKELGIYMTLGMGKRKISLILVMETFLVGVISLISGLILGIGASQGLATFALKLFDVPINEYNFTVSTGSIGKTVLYFGIMFLLVMIFNVFVISKYKIIDLLTAGKKNQDVKFKNSTIYLIAFILCVGSLGFAYKSILKVGFNVLDPMVLISIAFGILGTVLFFFSLSGLILYVVKKNKKVYFKGLNIFVIKQINSKVNTNFISMSLICLMLFFTIVSLSMGIGFKTVMDAGIKNATPFDASISVRKNDGGYNIEDVLKKINFKISKNEKSVVHNEYLIGMNASDFLTTGDFKTDKVVFVKLSDYNKILKFKNEKEVNLTRDEVLILSNTDKFMKPINEKIKKSNKINIKGKEYLIKNTEVIEENLQTSYFVSSFFTIVINDEFLSGYKISNSVLNVNYLNKNREKYNKKYQIRQDYGKGGTIIGISKDGAHSEKMVTTNLLIFIVIYLGIVFLITSMAVLALQQLSEASDSVERYKALRRLGANEKMINKTIFVQTLIYFSLPVSLALIHSVVGIKVTSNLINSLQETNINFSALVAALIFIVIYAGYFYTTYVGYKNIVRNNL